METDQRETGEIGCVWCLSVASDPSSTHFHATYMLDHSPKSGNPLRLLAMGIHDRNVKNRWRENVGFLQKSSNIFEGPYHEEEKEDTVPFTKWSSGISSVVHPWRWRDKCRSTRPLKRNFHSETMYRPGSRLVGKSMLVYTRKKINMLAITEKTKENSPRRGSYNGKKFLFTTW
jgi:hypothetical protein